MDFCEGKIKYQIVPIFKELTPDDDLRLSILFLSLSPFLSLTHSCLQCTRAHTHTYQTMVLGLNNNFVWSVFLLYLVLQVSKWSNALNLTDLINFKLLQVESHSQVIQTAWGLSKVGAERDKNNKWKGQKGKTENPAPFFMHFVHRADVLGAVCSKGHKLMVWPPILPEHLFFQTSQRVIEPPAGSKYPK